MFEIAENQQTKFGNLLKKNEFIESEYNKLSKIVHIKDFEMKVVKDLADKNNQDKNKYMEDLKKFRVGTFISSSTIEKHNIAKNTIKSDCQESADEYCKNEFTKPGNSSSEKSVENLFKSTIKKEGAMYEFQKIQSENQKMKDSVKDLLRLMNEILVKSNSEIPQNKNSSYLPFLQFFKSSFLSTPGPSWLLRTIELICFIW